MVSAPDCMYVYVFGSEIGHLILSNLFHSEIRAVYQISVLKIRR